MSRVKCFTPSSRIIVNAWLITLAVFLSSLGCDVSARALPQWSPEDQVRLEKGELVVGASLLVDPAPNRAQPVSPDVVPVVPTPIAPMVPLSPLEPVPPGVELDTTQIPVAYLDDYFTTSLESYLIDPQRLFSNQETLDQEGFLDYYAGESEVDIRVYLFDAQQEIPVGYSLKRLVEERYAEGSPTAVVFYFLGNPERNQMMFGGKETVMVSDDALRKMLDQAKIKALEKSDSASQMESFIVQLSISIYWVEQSMLDAQSLETAAAVTAAGGGLEEDSDGDAETPGALAQIQPYLGYGIIGLVSGFLSLLALALALVLWRRSRRYTFPVLDLPRRLGADYAAGIGAVIGFRNNQDSPSSQRDQIPDYLTRL